MGPEAYWISLIAEKPNFTGFSTECMRELLKRNTHIILMLCYCSSELNEFSNTITEHLWRKIHLNQEVTNRYKIQNSVVKQVYYNNGQYTQDGIQS